MRAAQRIVEVLLAHDVRYVFGVPGAKIDAVYDALLDGGPEIVVCRHEQNAAFMAAAIGRLTGRPGVVVVTSGPGTSNLATGLLTATTEQDPVVAVCGAVPRGQRSKRTHQSMEAVQLLAPVTKFSREVDAADDVPETLENAFRAATAEPCGAAALVLPSDVAAEPTTATAAAPSGVPRLGPAAAADVERAAAMIARAKRPVLLVGARGASQEVCLALDEAIAGSELPVVETFQAAGVIPRELEAHYLGRVGLFRNQPGDVVVARADLVVAIGYDPVEYDPELWNPDPTRPIVHLDSVVADVDDHYQPALELRGDIAATLRELAPTLRGTTLDRDVVADIDEERRRLTSIDAAARCDENSGNGLPPAAVVLALRDQLDDDATIACDIGSVYIYMARHFRVYRPRHLLFSNGQQTLGVALPWAMAAALVRPGTQVVSISGDGGFLFSAQELETAQRLGLSFTHVILRDNTYDMVGFQEQLKYGRKSGVQLGDYDTTLFAAAFGARGYRVSTMAEFRDALQHSLEGPGISIVDVAVDYSRNVELAAHLPDDPFH